MFWHLRDVAPRCCQSKYLRPLLHVSRQNTDVSEKYQELRPDWQDVCLHRFAPPPPLRHTADLAFCHRVSSVWAAFLPRFDPFGLALLGAVVEHLLLRKDIPSLIEQLVVRLDCLKKFIGRF